MIKVVFFAVSKEYFGASREIEVKNLAQLKHNLLLISPKAKVLLESCKFATDKFLTEDSYEFHDNETLFVLPPSSGG